MREMLDEENPDPTDVAIVGIQVEKLSVIAIPVSRGKQDRLFSQGADSLGPFWSWLAVPLINEHNGNPIAKRSRMVVKSRPRYARLVPFRSTRPCGSHQKETIG